MNKFRDRIVPLIVSVCLLAYLFYALVYQNQTFNYLYLICFALVALLVLVPFAARIKVPNVLEIDTKLNELREQTDQELRQIKNSISSLVDVRVNPTLNQFTFLGIDSTYEQIAKVLGSTTDLKQPDSGKSHIETERVRFIRQAASTLNDAQLSLKAARVVKLIDTEHLIDLMSLDLGPDTLLGKNNFLIDSLINGGLKYLMSVEEHPSFIIKLESLRTFNMLYMDVYNNKKPPPDSGETSKMVNITADITGEIFSRIILICGQSLIYRNKILKAAEYLKRGEMPPAELKD